MAFRDSGTVSVPWSWVWTRVEKISRRCCKVKRLVRITIPRKRQRATTKRSTPPTEGRRRLATVSQRADRESDREERHPCRQSREGDGPENRTVPTPRAIVGIDVNRLTNGPWASVRPSRRPHRSHDREFRFPNRSIRVGPRPRREKTGFF